MKRQIFILFLAFAAMSCGTTTQQGATNGQPVNASEGCFSIRSVEGYTALGYRHAHVECQGDEHYLLTTTPNCRGLDSAVGLSISMNFDPVCSKTGAFLMYQDGNLPIRCRVQQVEAVADIDEARRTVEEREAPAGTK